MAETIGLIGIGLLGTAMAERLLGNGFEVVGYDTQSAARDRLSALGGNAVDAATSVIDATDCILLSLPDSDVVKVVVDDLRPKLRDGIDLLDTTTGSPDVTLEVARDLAPAGVRWLDTTVVGSSQQMRDGQATLLVSGVEAAYDQHISMLSQLCHRSFYVGESGNAARMKLVANLVIGLHRAVLAEGLTFAQAMGLDASTTLDVLSSSAAYSRMMDTKGQKMIDSDFSTQARLSQHFKDVGLILANAAASGTRVPLTEVHRELLQRVLDDGDGDLDNSAIIKAFRRNE